jgi:hypothetical protein
MPEPKATILYFDLFLFPIWKIVLRVTRRREKIAPDNLSAIADKPDKLNSIFLCVL